MLDEWTSFFSTLAGVSGTIMALAFVTFQLRLELWRHNLVLHMIAVRTLGEFMAPLFFSLIFLLPSHPWNIMGAIIGSTGCLYVFAYQVVSFTRWRSFDSFNKIQLFGSFIMYVEFGAIYYFSFVAPNLTIVAAILAWLVLSGFIEAWWFLAPGKDSK